MVNDDYPVDLSHLDALTRFFEKHPPNLGHTLVVGSKVYKDKVDRRVLYGERALGLDMLPGHGVDIVHDLTNPLEGAGLFDHVDCCSVLEHVSNPFKFAVNVEDLMRPGASILISVPFVWRVHGYPSDYWRFTPEAVKEIFPSIDWTSLVFACNGRLRKKIGAARIKGKVYLERCELLGFGVKRGSL